jgi:hypothetical protein
LKRWALLILVALASIFGLMTNSQAITSTLGANDYTFKAYDLTQVTVWSNTWNACLDPCHIPLVTATSHFGATMNTGTDLKHYWDPDITNQEIVNPPFYTSVGQAVGVICWTSNSQWGVTDKIDARFSIKGTSGFNPDIPGGSYLWIGYVSDTYVNLTYSQRINYVPHC